VSQTEKTQVVAALVGAGFMGRVHSRALRAAGITMRGILSSSADKSKLAAQELVIDNYYSSYEELLADESVNVVHILTPNSSHVDLTERALAAGKHVVCEKPLATTSADANKLAKQSRELGLVGAIPFVYRYHPMVREAKSRVESGNLGRVLSIKGEYLQDWLLNANDTNWRVAEQSGGASRAFADIGIHLCDLIEFISGQRIVKLVATIDTAHKQRSGHAVSTEDLAMVLAKLDGGGSVSLMVSQVAAGHKNGLSVELHGTAESLRFDQETPESLWIGLQDGSRTIMRDPSLLSADAARLTALPAGHPEGYFDAFVSFMRDVEQAVNGQSPIGLPVFEDGARAAVLTEAVLLSAAQGTWVDVR
jgi:predicted dehydrogenase